MARRRNLKRWLEARRKDQYYRRAKEQGYRSRAAYKLLEVLDKFHIIHEGDKVLDLGAAPGGWSQVASEIAGDSGLVVSVDLKPIEPFQRDNIKVLNLDISSGDALSLLRSVSGDGFNVIISDASPNITGAWDLDHYRQMSLASTVIDLAEEILRPGGNLLVKLFDGPEVKPFKDKVKGMFKYVKLIKPKASRIKSSEIYLLGVGFKASKPPLRRLQGHPS
ncbi:MAG: RlmE family RNA methyltransferase [Candidatus Bathyarchaeia archaeon]|nr:RlmE family RNA methyltransferase [Candidatus Bathyarchaeota archaeon]